MSANGQVTIGFSKPYVAKYAAENGQITYSNGQPLARGVEVNVDPESSEANNFYADNNVAESEAGTFTGGKFSLVVDGLLIAAERTIMGLPEAVEGLTAYNDDQKKPYCGIGFIRKTRRDGVDYWIPYILVKTRFDEIPTAAETKGETIDWQTQDLSGSIFRGDDAKHTWRYIGDPCETEAAAEAVIKTHFNIQS